MNTYNIVLYTTCLVVLIVILILYIMIFVIEYNKVYDTFINKYFLEFDKFYDPSTNCGENKNEQCVFNDIESLKDATEICNSLENCHHFTYSIVTKKMNLVEPSKKLQKSSIVYSKGYK